MTFPPTNPEWRSTVDWEIEIYVTTLDEGARRDSDSHGAGVIDLMSFPADQPHHYRSIGGPARILGMHQYPRGRPRVATDESDADALG